MKRDAKKRVLIISPQPFYEDRGTPIAVSYICQALTELDLLVDLATYPIGSDRSIEGLRIIRSNNPFRFRSVRIGFSLKKLILNGPLFMEAARLVNRYQYHKIHAVEEAIFAAIYLCRKDQGRVIYDMASSLPEQMMGVPGFGNRLSQYCLNELERWALTRADNVICSAGLANKVRSIAPQAPVSEWQFPVHIDGKHSAEGSCRRSELGFDDDTIVVSYTGSFADYQGINTLAKSIPAVLYEHPDVAFVLVGGTEAEIAGVARVIPPNVFDRVKLIPRQDRKFIPSYIDAADILLSTREEGGNLPLKVYEYLAAGKPIVASDTIAHRSVLSGDIALLFKSGAEGLSRAIGELVRNPEEARRLADNAARYARENLSWEAFRNSLARIYFSDPGVFRAHV